MKKMGEILEKIALDEKELKTKEDLFQVSQNRCRLFKQQLED